MPGIHSVRIGYDAGADYYTNLYSKYAQEMIQAGNTPMAIEDFVKILKEAERTGNAQGGRIGYAGGGNVFELLEKELEGTITP